MDERLIVDQAGVDLVCNERCAVTQIAHRVQ